MGSFSCLMKKVELGGLCPQVHREMQVSGATQADSQLRRELCR